MKGISSLETLIEDVEECVQAVFLQGINSIDNKNIENLKALSKECEEFGLSYASLNIIQITNELENIKRNINWDKSTCIKEICRLNEYLDIVKKKAF